VSRSKSSLIRFCLATLLLSSVLPLSSRPTSQVSAQNSPTRRRFRESVSIATDSQVMKRLGTAQDHLAAQEWGEAVPILQQLIETSGDTLLPVETGRYWNAADHCHLLISRLPAEGLAVYRTRVDPQAAEWFEQAEKSLDPALFERVVSLAFNSSSGDDALWRLGSLAFEQGRYAVARHHWQLLVPPARPTPEDAQEPTDSPYLTYPDSTFDADIVHARLILCTIFEGDGERGGRELAAFQKLHPDAEGTLAGQTGRLSEILKATLKQSEGWWLGRAVPDEVRTFAGQPSRNPLPASEQSPGPRLWTRRLPEIRFRGPAPPALRGPQRLLAYFPVVYRDTVYLCTSHSIFALDLATGGSPNWPPDPNWPPEAGGGEKTDASPANSVGEETDDAKSPPAEQPGLDGEQRRVLLDADQESTRIFTNSTEDAYRIIRNPVGIARYTMTVADGRLYARMGPPISRRSSHEGSAISEIVGLDIESGQGLLVFRVTSDILDPDASSPEATAWSYEGTPVVHDGRVYVSARRGTPEDEISVACFDAASSQLLWQQRVCSNLGPDIDRSSLLDHRLLTLGDGRLFLATGTGAIASLDAATGRILWIVTYDSGAHAAQPTSSLSNVNHPSRNGLLPCVYHRGMVFVATADANRVFALDAMTGQLAWQVENKPDEWVRHLLGVVRGRLIVSGNHLAALDIFTGETAWKISHPNADAWTHGRGAVTADSVYWPLRTEIARVSIRSGAVQRRFQLTRSDGLAGGNLVIAGGRLLVVTHDQITVLKNLDAPAAPPAKEEEKVGELSPAESTRRALHSARAAEDIFQPHVAAAQFRSALRLASSPQLLPERRAQVEHVSARGLVRCSLALAGVSPEPAKRPYFQTAWLTTAAHPHAFSPAERIRTILDFAGSEPDPRTTERAVRAFAEQTGLAQEPWLLPLQYGEPVQKTVAELLQQATDRGFPEASPQPIRPSALPVVNRPAHLLRRSWTQSISETAKVLAPVSWQKGVAPRLLIQDSTLTCVDAAKGTPLWKTAAGENSLRAFLISGGPTQSATSSDGLILVGEKSAQSRDADTGQIRWSIRWPEPIQFFLTEFEAGSRRLLCLADESISAVDAASGAELWRFPPRHQQPGIPSSAIRNPHAVFLHSGTVGFFQPRGLANSYLLDLRTGFPQTRNATLQPLPNNSQLIFDEDGASLTTGLGITSTGVRWTVAGVSENNRLSLSHFASDNSPQRSSLRELGIGLHSPVLLADDSPFTVLIENGFMAERIDVRSGTPLWRVRLESPLDDPRSMTALTGTALFATVDGFLKRFALLDGATEWQRDLGEGSWQIVDATEQILFALGTTENSSSPHSELLLCDGRSGDFVQRLRFPERIEFDDVHIGSGFVIVRAGNTLHGLAAREVQSPMQTTSFKVR
jgi:outer membrane protein assembly factor BamB